MGLFGKEKITLHLEKYSYKPGENIKGTIKLNLKKPTQARKLEVRLIGRRINKQSGISAASLATGNSRNRSKTQYQTVYDFKLPVDGDKEYHNEEFPFEIPIPADILSNNPTLDGKLGQAATAVKMLTGVSSRIDWIVKAQLDVPKAFDVKKSQKIVLNE